MTKEEYERLLSSDYWKGYSYSLIKERNFTCEDCGRQFPNERNKLQVHHLVYRDINPWSYKPEELVVLCKECHEKRHGIVSKPELQTQNIQPEIFGNYTKSYSSANYNNQEKSFPSYQSESSTNNLRSSSTFDNSNEELNQRRVEYQDYQKRKKELKRIGKYVLIFILLFCAFIAYIIVSPSNYDNKKLVEDVAMTDSIDEVLELDDENYLFEDDEFLDEEMKDEIKVSSPHKNEEKTKVHTDEDRSDEDWKHVSNKKEKSTLELLEEHNHAEVVKQAKEAGVSTQGSTLDIMERINHAEVVKQAKEAGVSTKGSTLEIMERINHAEVVKQAKEAGVSTQGSTLDIMERINHAEVVKQAKESGVSTKGTTLEIMERITRKELEKY